MRIAVASEATGRISYFGHCASFTQAGQRHHRQCQNMRTSSDPARIAAAARVDVTAVITGIIERDVVKRCKQPISK
ncbi:MAG: hypothetical protein ACLT98_16420 [Eggerthellaceae bacterium]